MYEFILQGRVVTHTEGNVAKDQVVVTWKAPATAEGHLMF